MALDIFSVDGAGLQVENYIYMYHLQEFIVLPSFIDSVQENFHISWQPTIPLGRSAPIYSFQSSGPRTLQMTFDLHRDLMYQINKDVSDAKVALGDDYIDTLIKDLQACVLPDYDGTSKSVNPPVVALRVGEDIFIKGVITSNLGITWKYPLLSNGKYSNISINFEIAEIDPYDARTARVVGSYRNLNTELDYGNINDIVSDSSGSVKSVGSVGATNMLPVTGTADVGLRRDENGNPIPAVPSGNSNVNQPEMTYFKLIENTENTQTNSTTSTWLKTIDTLGSIFSPGYNIYKYFNNKKGSNTSNNASSFPFGELGHTGSGTGGGGIVGGGGGLR